MSYQIEKLKNIALIKTGKLDSNAAVTNGVYPFFTCDPITLKIDEWAYDTEAVLLAGNNASGNYTAKYYKGKFNAYQRTYIIESANTSLLSVRFLAFAITQQLRLLKAMSTGSTTKFLTIKMLNDLEIPCPEISVQQKIASIIGSYDNLIENNQKQIKLLEEAAQRLYKEWFIDLRFPGHENVEIVDGVPEGWYIDRADHYFKITIGKTPSRAEKQWFTNSGEGTPWISISDMGESGAFTFYSKEDLTADAIIRHNMKVVPKGTILVSFKLTVGRVAITSIDMCTNEAIAHFHIDNDLDRAYTYCYLKNFEYDSLGNTSSISKAINSKIIKSMPFIMPTRDILRQFFMIVQPILNQIELKQKMIFRLTEARDRLLPKLMSGEIEV
jgi:hypothetical protein